MTVHRQITSCQAHATITVTHRASRGTNRGSLLWQVYVCDRHRLLPLQLTGASSLNHKATHPITGTPPRCGTLHDHQPIHQAIESHARTWLHAPTEHPDRWVERLSNAAALAAHVGAGQAGALDQIARIAEAGPDSPVVQARVLELLARAETAAAAAARR
ncbi:hypothetical protein [Streptomyces sp. NPDC006193]|uniref:hypothetical protein n=1 Tax=Streptomyces sp. NPDC006193 TaxID=3155717 RepID=UPI0033AC0B2C